MRTLVVDDSMLFRMALVEWLEGEGICEVVGVAGDGWEAFELARAQQPDLILMDLNMPIWNGLEATRRIKAEMPGVRILLLTASSADRVRGEAISCGAEDCLDKDASKIRPAVERLARQRNGNGNGALAAL